MFLAFSGAMSELNRVFRMRLRRIENKDRSSGIADSIVDFSFRVKAGVPVFMETVTSPL